MRNVIFVDSILFLDEIKEFNENFLKNVSVFPRIDSVDVVDNVISMSKDIMHYCVVVDAQCTDMISELNRKHPNNTVIYSGDIQKTVNSIQFIFSDFGRCDKTSAKVFFTADTHFSHNNIIQYCNRPFKDIDEMNEYMIRQWNSVVGENDKVYHLGDFCFGKKENIENIFPRLNGKIDLILGNHDRRKIKDYYDIGFHRVYDHPILINGFMILSHAPLMFVQSPWFNIFGHIHTTESYKTWSKSGCCVCVERHDYKPVSLEDIKRNCIPDPDVEQ